MCAACPPRLLPTSSLSSYRGRLLFPRLNNDSNRRSLSCQQPALFMYSLFTHLPLCDCLLRAMKTSQSASYYDWWGSQLFCQNFGSFTWEIFICDVLSMLFSLVWRWPASVRQEEQSRFSNIWIKLWWQLLMVLPSHSQSHTALIKQISLILKRKC